MTNQFLCLPEVHGIIEAQYGDTGISHLFPYFRRIAADVERGGKASQGSDRRDNLLQIRQGKFAELARSDQGSGGGRVG
jgi:hypothetical protein